MIEQEQMNCCYGYMCTWPPWLVLFAEWHCNFLVSLHFRGNPSVQGNSVLALAGLARAVSIFVQQQSSSGTTESYQRNAEWLNMVADTLMVVLDGNYKAKGPTLVWCQQVNSYKLLYELSWNTSAFWPAHNTQTVRSVRQDMKQTRL